MYQICFRSSFTQIWFWSMTLVSDQYLFKYVCVLLFSLKLLYYFSILPVLIYWTAKNKYFYNVQNSVTFRIEWHQVFWPISWSQKLTVYSLWRHYWVHRTGGWKYAENLLHGGLKSTICSHSNMKLGQRFINWKDWYIQQSTGKS